MCGRGRCAGDGSRADRRDLVTRVAEARPEVQARVRLARALALKPSLLLVEHPSATLPRESVRRIRRGSRSCRKRARSLAVLAITADPAFANALGGQVLTHEPATGATAPPDVWRKLFGRS